MRAETSDKAEIVSQMLFGECYEVICKQDNWYKIQLATDGYSGWIDFKQHTPVSVQYYQEWMTAKHPRVMDLVQFVNGKDYRIPVGIGCYLPFYNGTEIRVNDKFYSYSGKCSTIELYNDIDELLKVAANFLKAPYLWGGKSIFGIDCSGFVQQVYGICGYQLPRDASQQIAHGKEVYFVNQTQPGDLAYFSNSDGRIIHVGLLLEDQKIMHASGEVRIDTLDHNGIYRTDFKRYSHNLRSIKRIL
nr:C40 family peptidase [Pontibacter silvestris]